MSWTRPGAQLYSSLKQEVSSNLPPDTTVDPAAIVPNWGMTHDRPVGSDQATCIDGYASGWPLLSMRTFWIRDPIAANVPKRIRTGIELSGMPWREGNDITGIRVLPLGIISIGFAINTIFYAATLSGGWLLFAFPFVIRRSRRIKRGLCPACGYPVGTSDVCSECGLRVHRATASGPQP